jgi:hypothetical protein
MWDYSSFPWPGLIHKLEVGCLSKVDATFAEEVQRHGNAKRHMLNYV